MAEAARRVTRAGGTFDLVPSRAPAMSVAVTVARAAPEDATVIGVPVASDGDVPRERLDLDRATLDASGFTARVGETLVLPRADGPARLQPRELRRRRPVADH